MAAQAKRGGAKLAEYRAKRDFGKTPEPTGGGPSRGGDSFVVQKHAARRLHYDFRLELDGVLKSWAVTKGPSLDPADRRLAVHTEDHPLDYGGFEGVIPQGQYGGGTVMLWDRGTWVPVGDPHEGYARGNLKFVLHGARMTGRWVLIRMGGKAARERRENWLLIKEKDEHARPGAGTSLIERETVSVTTGRTMDAIAADRDRVWDSKSGEQAAPSKPAAGDGRAPGGKKARLPKTVEPQLATLAPKPPSGDGWLHEIKFDGYRALCRIEKGTVRVLTRSGLDWTEKFPSIAKTLGNLAVETAILDGEIVVQNEAGVSEFKRLQQALKSGDHGRMVYFAFDLLYQDGHDLRGVPLARRKAALSDLVASLGAVPNVLYSDHIEGRGGDFYTRACGMALEGVVWKKADAPYRPGRGRDWLKSKCAARQEFVIGGYTKSASRIGGIAGLVVGYWEGDRLVYAGKVGTGYSAQMAGELKRRLDEIVRPDPPFAEVPRSARRDVVWAEPKLVAEVEYLTWTESGLLRHASFEGLREDKDPKTIVREDADMPSAPTIAAPRPELDLDRLGVRLTSPDKILYDESGVTKRGLAEYYAVVADLMLPHVAQRPLSLVRCPEGSTKECFYQRHPSQGMPPDLHPVKVREKQGLVDSIMIRDLKGLVSLVQIGALEIHPWGARIDDSERPDRLVLDLDPDEGLPFARVVAAAHEVRGFLKDELGLESFVKTTGGKGLHVMFPVVRRQGWAEAKAFTKAIAAALARARPEAYVDNMSKKKRVGKIYVDYLRNDRSATAVGVWSSRARKGATVSVPLAWEELTPGLDPAGFTVETVPRRVAGLKADPWAEMAKLRQSITAKAKKAVGLS